MTKQSCMGKEPSYIYILTNITHRVIYIGVTTNLVKRIYEHRSHLVKGFTQKYNVTKLVYYEEYKSLEEAIKREKQLKGGSREKKLRLIENSNPFYDDLYNSLL